MKGGYTNGMNIFLHRLYIDIATKSRIAKVVDIKDGVVYYRYNTGGGWGIIFQKSMEEFSTLFTRG